jgi:ribonuclease HII
MAGPLVAAAVRFDYERMGADGDARLADLNDSKKLSSQRRAALLPVVLELADIVMTAIVPAAQIDREGLHVSNMRAPGRVLDAVTVDGSADLVDGFELKGVASSPRPIVRGDQTSAAIAAASIVAKETRDWLMRQLDEQYPGYGFAVHKGYITPAHVAATVELGPSPAHRRSVRWKASPVSKKVHGETTRLLTAVEAGGDSGRPVGETKAATPQPTKKKAAAWKSLPDAEKAQYLLDHQTLSDRTWTDQARLRGEKREAFIRRILLGGPSAVGAQETAAGSDQKGRAGMPE